MTISPTPDVIQFCQSNGRYGYACNQRLKADGTCERAEHHMKEEAA
jgi:hypothetical protein